MRRLLSYIFFTTCTGLSSFSVEAQGPLLAKTPNDEFSRTFLTVYRDASKGFNTVKGKVVYHGNMKFNSCKKILPGATDAYIIDINKPVCVFDFGTYKTRDEADAQMRKLGTKVANAFAQKAMVKFIDTTNEEYVVKRTSIAELVDGGFYAYNINIDLLRSNNPDNEEYKVELSMTGGAGILYKVIWKTEPSRSPYFCKTFKTMFAQFNTSDAYYCNEALPGFTCNKYDSSGKDQLMMEKPLNYFRESRVEFECVTSNIRSMLGDKFVYYIPDPHGNVEREVVFVLADDYDKTERRSITTSLIKDGEEDYRVRLVMYHP